MEKVGKTMSSARHKMGRSETRACHKLWPGEDCSCCDREGRTGSGCLCGALWNVFSPAGPRERVMQCNSDAGRVAAGAVVGEWSEELRCHHSASSQPEGIAAPSLNFELASVNVSEACVDRQFFSHVDNDKEAGNEILHLPCKVMSWTLMSGAAIKSGSLRPTYFTGMRHSLVGGNERLPFGCTASGNLPLKDASSGSLKGAGGACWAHEVEDEDV